MVSNPGSGNGVATLLIRADASPKIGTGHIMRCLALAQAWQRRGGTATFMSCCESASLRRRITGERFNLVPIEKTHPDRSDLRITLEKLSALNHEQRAKTWVVLDGYHFDSSYQKNFKTADCSLLVIDDMSHLSHYHADVLLNQNIHAEKLSYSCGTSTRLLLGPRFNLLRQEFLAWKGRSRGIPDVARKILVTLGGADRNNVTFRIVNVLKNLQISDLEITIAIGLANCHREMLQKEASSAFPKIKILQHVENMSELMASADLAVSGGGTTCLEMAFMGLPNAVIILAENQRSAVEELSKEDCSINLGEQEKITSKIVTDAMEKLIYGKDLRIRMSEKGPHIIDGIGVERVLDTIMQIDSTQSVQSP